MSSGLNRMGLTHRESFLKKNNLPLNTSLSLAEISKLSKVPIRILKEVEKRAGGRMQIIQLLFAYLMELRIIAHLSGMEVG